MVSFWGPTKVGPRPDWFLEGFNSKFPTSIPAPFMWEFPPRPPSLPGLKWWKYEFHVLETQNEEINEKNKIIAVKDAFHAVAKRKRYLSVSTTLDKICWDRSRKCLFVFLSSWQKLKPSPNEFPPSSYHSKLFRTAWQSYTLVFRPRQFWIGVGEGAYFFFLEAEKLDGPVSAVLSGVVSLGMGGLRHLVVFFRETFMKKPCIVIHLYLGHSWPKVHFNLCTPMQWFDCRLGSKKYQWFIRKWVVLLGSTLQRYLISLKPFRYDGVKRLYNIC